MGHVNDEVGTDGVGNLAHARIVDETAVGRGTGDQALGAVELSIVLKHIVVNDTGVEVDTVREGLEIGRDSRDPGQ